MKNKVKKSKIIKDNLIYVRVNSQEKEIYQKKAKESEMNLSELIINLLEGYEPVIYKINGGEQIAQALYKLNETLNKNENSQILPVEEVRATTARILKMLNSVMIPDEEGVK